MSNAVVFPVSANIMVFLWFHKINICFFFFVMEYHNIFCIMQISNKSFSLVARINLSYFFYVIELSVK